MKLNLAHVVTYIVAGLVWLASLDQTLVTSLVGPSLAKYATGVIVLAGALVVFLQHVGVISPPAASTSVSVSPTVNKAAGFSRIGMLICLATAALTITACATVSSWIASPTGIEVDVAAVDIAVATAESKGVTAATINRVAKAALAADAGTPATIGAVSTAVNGAIAKANLPAGDTLAINLIEAALSEAITAKIGANPSVTALQTDVASVLNLVISATGG
jgi:hypothetical protein